MASHRMTRLGIWWQSLSPTTQHRLASLSLSHSRTHTHTLSLSLTHIFLWQGMESNCLAYYFHNIGGRVKLDDNLHTWLMAPQGWKTHTKTHLCIFITHIYKQRRVWAETTAAVTRTDLGTASQAWKMERWEREEGAFSFFIFFSFSLFCVCVVMWRIWICWRFWMIFRLFKI